jgi:ankyrin repeat protein
VKDYTDTAISLIEAGAVVNAKDKYEETPLHWAAWNGHTDTTISLIEARADVNAVRILPLSQSN